MMAILIGHAKSESKNKAWAADTTPRSARERPAEAWGEAAEGKESARRLTLRAPIIIILSISY
jgi:hypothetical protein